MPIRTGILVIPAGDPDTAEESVRAVATLLQGTLSAFFLVHRQTLPSQRYLIEECLRYWCDEEEIDLIVTIGGTFPAVGPSPDEIVPEATQSVIERLLPSLPETMRATALYHDRLAILDRGVAGIRGRTLLINLPGDPRLASLFLESVVDLLPPILAQLQPESEGQAPQAKNPPGEDGQASKRAASPTKTLDPEEFAAFLRTRRQRDSE